MSFYPSDPKRMHKVNVEGTKHLLEAAFEKNVSHFIYVSSTEAIGASVPPHHSPEASLPPLKEDSPLTPRYPYGETKVEAEKMIQRLCSERGRVKFTIVRPTGLIGPLELRPTLTDQLFWAANVGLFFFSPRPTQNIVYTHVSDAARGIVRCLSAPQALNETFILCADDFMSYSEVIAFVNQCCGRSPPLFTLPTWLVKTVVSLASPLLNLRTTCSSAFLATFRLIGVAFSEQLLFHPKTIDQLTLSRKYSNEKAKQRLSFAPQYTMRDAIRGVLEARFEQGAFVRFPVSPVLIVLLLLVGLCWLLWNVW